MFSTKKLDLNEKKIKLSFEAFKLNKKDNFIKLKKLIKFSRKNEKPVACLIKKDVLTNSKKNFQQNKYYILKKGAVLHYSAVSTKRVIKYHSNRSYPG